MLWSAADPDAAAAIADPTTAPTSASRLQLPLATELTPSTNGGFSYLASLDVQFILDRTECA